MQIEKHEIVYEIKRTATGGYTAVASVDGRPTLYTPSALNSEAAAAKDGAAMVRRLRKEYGLDATAPSAERRYLGGES
jgi:hypothetical protein